MGICLDQYKVSNGQCYDLTATPGNTLFPPQGWACTIYHAAGCIGDGMLVGDDGAQSIAGDLGDAQNQASYLSMQCGSCGFHAQGCGNGNE